MHVTQSSACSADCSMRSTSQSSRATSRRSARTLGFSAFVRGHGESSPAAIARGCCAFDDGRAADGDHQQGGARDGEGQPRRSRSEPAHHLVTSTAPASQAGPWGRGTPRSSFRSSARRSSTRPARCCSPSSCAGSGGFRQASVGTRSSAGLAACGRRVSDGPPSLRAAAPGRTRDRRRRWAPAGRTTRR